jgi:Ni/Fe-hydrogenase subunit HybB-like protein
MANCNDTLIKGMLPMPIKPLVLWLMALGYLHVAWGLHNQPLNYAVGIAPGSLVLSAQKLQ